MAVNTNRNIRITVTKNDIRLGVKGDVEKCPIARACKRLGLKDVSVEGDIVKHRGTAVRTEWDGTKVKVQRIRALPVKAADFITKFDEGEAVEPFTFTLK